MKSNKVNEYMKSGQVPCGVIQNLNQAFIIKNTVENLVSCLGMIFFEELDCGFFAIGFLKADMGYIRSKKEEKCYSFNELKNIIKLKNSPEYSECSIMESQVELKDDVMVYGIQEQFFDFFNTLIPLFKLYFENISLSKEIKGGFLKKKAELSKSLKQAEQDIGEKSVLFILSEIFSSSLLVDSKITSSLEILKTYLNLECIMLHYRDGSTKKRFFSGKVPEYMSYFENLINNYSYEYDCKRGRVYFLDWDEGPKDKCMVLLELVQKQKGFGFIMLPLCKSKKEIFKNTDFYKTFAGIFAQGIMIDFTISRLKSLKNFNINILESMTSGLFCINNSGKITRINHSAILLLFGKGNYQIIGKDYNDFECMRPFANLIYKTINEDKEFSGQEINFLLKEEKRIFGMSTSLLKDNNEKIGALIIFRDLTRIQNLKKKFFQREKLAALGEMAAKVAHEIKNPLTTIRGFIELISNELPENRELRKFSKMVFNEVDYLVETLDDLLRFTRASEPTEEYELFDIDINQFVSDVLFVEKLSKKIGSINFEKKFFKDLPLARVEPRKLKRVLSNLIINAVEAYEAWGNNNESIEFDMSHLIIRVTTYNRDDGYIALKITDNGPGINEKIKNKIFSPFFTTKGRGTGLGLAICERIMNKMSGNLRFRSIKDVGTCFEVLLKKSD